MYDGKYNATREGVTRRGFLHRLGRTTGFGVMASLGFAGVPEVAKQTAKDINNYRKYAVTQGSRSSSQSLRNAIQHLINVGGGEYELLTLGYGVDAEQGYKANDFRLGQILRQTIDDVDRTIGGVLQAIYSIFDAVTLDALPNPPNEEYNNTPHPMRPLRFAGSSICDLARTGIDLANIPTLGLADNVLSSAYKTLDEVVEAVKETAQAGTNLLRKPAYLIASKDKADRVVDWVALVPLEWATNVAKFEGFTNLDRNNYQRMLKEKGYTGLIIEFAGSSWLLYKAINRDHHHHRSKKKPEEKPPEFPELPGESKPPKFPRLP